MKRRRFVNAEGGSERYVYGVHPVTAWLRVRPAHVIRVLFDRRSVGRVTPVTELAAAAGIPVEAADEAGLSTLAGSRHHHGVVAQTRPFPYATLDEVLRQQPRVVLCVDQVQDPQNLGAMLRTGLACGLGGVVIPKDGAVSVTAAVEAAAAGAAAQIRICRVTNMARTLAAMKGGGYWVVGLTPRQGVDLHRWEPAMPCAVVVGGERGMRRLVREQCDQWVSIPMQGVVESLNASVAVAIVLYELLRAAGRLRTTS